MLGGAVTLTTVLEPIGDLSGRESRRFGQLPLLAWRRIRVVTVPIPQNGS